MPSMNIDELAEKLFEPIMVTIDGKEYTVTTMPSEAFDGMNPESGDINAVRKFLANVLNVDEKKFKKTDYRKITAAGTFIMREARKQVESYTSKNEQGEGVDQKR